MKESVARQILNRSREGYNRIAEPFSASRKNFWDELAFIKDCIKEGDDVLDLGCGNGRFFEFLMGKKAKYAGVDSSEKMVELAIKKYGDKDSSFITGDALSLPFEEMSFDKVISIGVLHHIPSAKCRDKFFAEARRVLKNNGILILTVWNLWKKKQAPKIIKHSILKILGLSSLDFKDIFLDFGNEKNVRYLHAFTKREINSLAKKNNFKIEKLFKIRRASGQENYVLICRK